MNTSEATQHFKEYRYVTTLERRINKLNYYYEKNPKNHKVYNTILFLRRRLAYLNDYYSGRNKFNITSSLIKKIQYDINKLKPLSEHWKEITNTILKEDKYIEHNPIIRISMNTLKERNKKTAKYQHQFLLELQLREAIKENHYILFDTLTVKTEYLNKIFAKNSKIWKNYITSFRRTIGKVKYGNKRMADAGYNKEKYHSYFAVTELGSKHGRLHIHVLHNFTYMPPLWSTDPNHYTSNPTRRLIIGPQNLWPYGHSYPIAVRISQFDAYGRLGWQWPIEKESREPIRATIPGALSNYMIKYITKGDQRCQNLNPWRVKKTRNLGKKILIKTLQETPTNKLKPLIMTEKIMKLNHKRIPKNLIRSMALKFLTTKMKEKISTQKLFLLMKTIQPQEGLVKHIRKQIETQRIPNYLTFGNSTTRNWETTVISDFEKRLNDNFNKYLTTDYQYQIKGVTHT
jgi:hypothetical protein